MYVWKSDITGIRLSDQDLSIRLLRLSVFVILFLQMIEKEVKAGSYLSCPPGSKAQWSANDTLHPKCCSCHLPVNHGFIHGRVTFRLLPINLSLMNTDIGKLYQTLEKTGKQTVHKMMH